VSALTEIILFVGGPADGQRLTIDAGKDSWEVYERGELGKYMGNSPGPEEVAFPTTRYRRQQTPGGHVMVAVGLGVNELVCLLIQHYTPGLARIEGPLCHADYGGCWTWGAKETEGSAGDVKRALREGSNRAVVVFQARR